MTFKEALNDAVRRGLAAETGSPGSSQAGAGTEPLRLGRRLIDIDNVAEALAVAEGEAFR